MISEAYSGTQVATIGVEHVLNTTSPDTSDGVYQLFVDVSALAAGDTVKIRIKEKVTSGDAQREVLSATLSGAQSSPAWVSPSFVLLHGWDMTIQQTTGTARSFSYSIRKVA